MGEWLHRVHTPAFTPMSKIDLLIIVCGDVRYKQRAVLFINYFKVVPIMALLLLERVVRAGMIKGANNI